MSDSSNPYQAPASAGEPVPTTTATGGVTPKTRELLGQAAPWIKFMTIMGYIGVAIMVIFAVFMIFFGSALGGAFGEMAGAMTGAVLGLVYLALAVLFFFPTRTLGKMGKAAKRYKAQGEAADLEGVAATVKGLAKFWGILTIVFIALYVVIIIGAIVVGVAVGSGQ